MRRVPSAIPGPIQCKLFPALARVAEAHKGAVSTQLDLDKVFTRTHK